MHAARYSHVQNILLLTCFLLWKAVVSHARCMQAGVTVSLTISVQVSRFHGYTSLSDRRVWVVHFAV